MAETPGWGAAVWAALQIVLEGIGMKKKADTQKPVDEQKAEDAVRGKTPPPKEEE